jgi:hypothetical protein
MAERAAITTRAQAISSKVKPWLRGDSFIEDLLSKVGFIFDSGELQ